MAIRITLSRCRWTAKRTPHSLFDWPKFVNNADGRRAADRKDNNLASSVHRRKFIFDEGGGQASTVEGWVLHANMDAAKSDVRIKRWFFFLVMARRRHILCWCWFPGSKQRRRIDTVRCVNDKKSMGCSLMIWYTKAERIEFVTTISPQRFHRWFAVAAMHDAWKFSCD